MLLGRHLLGHDALNEQTLLGLSWNDRRAGNAAPQKGVSSPDVKAAFLASPPVTEQTFHVEGRDDDLTRIDLRIAGSSGGRAGVFAFRERTRLNPPPNQLDLVVRQLRLPWGHRAGSNFLQQKTPDGISRNDCRPRLSPRENPVARL